MGGEGGAGLRFGQVNEVETRNSAPGTRVLRATQPAQRIIASKLMKHASEAHGACNSERALLALSCSPAPARNFSPRNSGSAAFYISS